MTEWREKSWGRVRTVVSTADCLVDELQIVPGGRSSYHRHHEHANRFVVVSGIVEITVVTAGTESRPLGPGESFEVPKNQWHQFHSPYGAWIYEIYSKNEVPWSIEQDIERQPQ